MATRRELLTRTAARRRGSRGQFLEILTVMIVRGRPILAWLKDAMSVDTVLDILRAPAGPPGTPTDTARPEGLRPVSPPASRP
jgi:hypothetical protein